MHVFHRQAKVQDLTWPQFGYDSGIPPAKQNIKKYYLVVNLGGKILKAIFYMCSFVEYV